MGRSHRTPFKLRDLHVLFAVAMGQHGESGAPSLLSQPVVSAAVAGLEQTLGVRLLDRTRRGVEPTMYGRALLDHGLAAFDALRQGVREIEFLADPTVGELRIGCPEWIAAGLLPVIIDRLLQQHPRIVFHVEQTITATPRFRELRERSLDLVMGRIVTPFLEQDLRADVLYESSFRSSRECTAPGRGGVRSHCPSWLTSLGSSLRRMNCRDRWWRRHFGRAACSCRSAGLFRSRFTCAISCLPPGATSPSARRRTSATFLRRSRHCR